MVYYVTSNTPRRKACGNGKISQTNENGLIWSQTGIYDLTVYVDLKLLMIFYLQ